MCTLYHSTLRCTIRHYAEPFHATLHRWYLRCTIRHYPEPFDATQHRLCTVLQMSAKLFAIELVHSTISFSNSTWATTPFIIWLNYPCLGCSVSRRKTKPSIIWPCHSFISYAMLQPILTYCGTLGLSFPDYRKEMIKNIERRGFKVIGNSSFNPPSVNNLIKRKSCLFVFDCLQNNVCTPFKNYFERLVHSKATRNNGISVKLPKVRLEFGKKSFYYQGAKTFNNLPAELRSLDSRLKFKNKLRDYFS